MSCLVVNAPCSAPTLSLGAGSRREIVSRRFRYGGVGQRGSVSGSRLRGAPQTKSVGAAQIHRHCAATKASFGCSHGGAMLVELLFCPFEARMPTLLALRIGGIDDQIGARLGDRGWRRLRVCRPRRRRRRCLGQCRACRERSYDRKANESAHREPRSVLLSAKHFVGAAA